MKIFKIINIPTIQIVTLLLLTLSLLTIFTCKDKKISSSDNDNKESGTQDHQDSNFPHSNHVDQDNISDEMKAIQIEEHKIIQKKFPDNLWVDGDYNPNEEIRKKKQKIKKEFNTLQEKIDDNSASGKEKKRYYKLKIKLYKDLVVLMEYSLNRIPLLEQQKGEKLIGEQEKKKIKEKIGQLKTELEELKKKSKE